MKAKQNQSFMKNVSIILFSQFAVKILGVVYRMVITNVDGFENSGSGYYSAGFNVYTLLLALSSVGIPNAIAKMTAEKIALGDRRGAHRIFKTALLLFSSIGIVLTALLFIGAESIATYVIAMPGAANVLKALSPSILFVCISAVIRGYFNGMKDMSATSASQILEQIFKCIFTIGIVLLMASYMLFPDEDTKAQLLAAGANFATTIATVLSLLYLFVFYTKRRGTILSSFENEIATTVEGSFVSVAKSILMISVPISLGSIISAINRIVDTATITRGIRAGFSDIIPAHDNIPAIINPTLEQLDKEAARLSGQLAKSDTLLNLPIALNIAFATVLVPSLSSALAVGNKKEASDKVSLSLLISLLIILPCAVGYITFAKQIYQFLYPAVPDAYELLQLSSIALIFIALNQTLSGSLQGCGKVYAPATGLFIGCIAKFILNVVLIRQPAINIYGAPISSIACQVISFSYSFNVLKKSVDINFSFIRYILKPLLAALIMAVVSYPAYLAIYAIIKVNIIALFIAIIIAVFVYAASVFSLGILKEDELSQIPMADKLTRFIRKK